MCGPPDDVTAIRWLSETSPVVGCEINGCRLRMLVDTGSRVTLLKEIGLGRIKNKNLKPCNEQSHKEFYGITGNQIRTKGSLLKKTVWISNGE